MANANFEYSYIVDRVKSALVEKWLVACSSARMPELENPSGVLFPRYEHRASTQLNTQSKFSLGHWALCISGCLLLFLIFFSRFASSDNVDDVTGFIIGAKLMGTQGIYDVRSNLELQAALTRHTNEGIIFVRPPFWALAMQPFTWFGYRNAMLCWKLLMASMLFACLFVCPRPQRRSYTIALCWSIPASAALALGNDVPFILLLVGASLALWRSGNRVWAGATLGLALAKFHFLILLPLLLFRRKYGRELIGFSASSAMLLGISFAVQPNWLPLYWRALNLPQRNMNAMASLEPNFYASFGWTAHPGIGVFAGALVVAVLLWRICARVRFDVAMPLCIFGAALAAPHTNYLDGVLAVPALLGVAPFGPKLRAACWILLSPAATCLYWLGPRYLGPAIFVAASTGLLYAFCMVTSKRRNCAGYCESPFVAIENPDLI